MHGTVVEVERLTPSMVRVVMGGAGLDELDPTPFTDQYVNALFVPDGAPYGAPFDIDAARAGAPEHRPVGRRYTIRRWDPVERLVTIDFVVHGDVGQAGRWASRAQVGDILQMTGPNGGYAPSTTHPWHLMVGDESALPAIAASLERVREDVLALAFVTIDGPDHELDLTCPGKLELRWVHRSAEGATADALVEAVQAATFPSGTPDVFVHGEASEVRAVRRHLLGERGVPKEGVSISPYWRRKFTDEAWREVKKEWLAEVAQDV
ncbi:MAG TPA: siderophore-interacting protein [Acidimicrobiales bacterium]